MFKALDGLSGMVGAATVDPKTTSRMEYVRVWRARYSMFDVEMQATEEQPCGVAMLDPDRHFWIRMDGKWIERKHVSNIAQNERGFRYQIITEAEYESDLAFGLWPKLRVTYRPVRSFFRRLARWQEKYRIAFLGIGLGVGFGLLNIDDRGDIITSIAMGCIFVGFLSVAISLVDMVTGHDKIKRIERLLGK